MHDLQLNDQAVLVKIEFLRVQTFLFAIPRLLQMVGANARLGQVIRHELTELIDGEKIKGIKIEPSTSFMTEITDPLKTAAHELANTSARGEILQAQLDKPEALYRRGILSRDGGHFHAVFEDDQNAKRFCRKAAELMAKELPGLRFEITRQRLNDDEPLDDQGSLPTTIAHLPHFRICEETGAESASCIEDEKALSEKAMVLRKAGKAFRDSQLNEYGLPGFDIVSLLQNQFPGYGLKRPTELKELAGPSGYIAVIHADGNAIGKRQKVWAGPRKDKSDPIQHEIQVEGFFHAMRVAVRASVVEALTQVFDEEALKGQRSLPYQILMLGGDDLLMVCQARFALPFIKEYATALKSKKCIPWREGKEREISIGAGVVIARHNIPFYRLHALAEELTGSAKRLYRSQRPNADGSTHERSVVDWLVTTATWVESPTLYRQQHQLVSYPYPPDSNTEETLALTGKPYFVLSEANADGNPDLTSLKGLLRASGEFLKKRDTARDTGADDSQVLSRSQLKDLVTALHEGRSFAEMRFRDAPKGLRDALKKYAGLTPEKLFYRGEDFPPNSYLTHLLDLVEIMEIGQLGRKSSDQEII